MTLGLPVATLLAFLTVLARVGGFVAFLPLPAIRSAPGPIRAALAVTLTFALFPAWPNLPDAIPSAGRLLIWAFSEAGFGLAVGLAVAFLMEGFQLAMQVVGLQAGYGYALTIDPTSQADSSVLQVLLMLATTWLFLLLGFDHRVLQILAASLERFPAGTWAPSAASVTGIVHLGSGMITTGVRLALPITALLLLIDVALALLGRMQQQLQLLSLAFPAKMLAALILLAALTAALPGLFSAAAERMITALLRLLG